ncbi:MAG: hypothetical protein EHM61_15385, partial [Acidobacteria bacterium]
AGTVDVTVRNFTDTEMSGTLELTLTQELDRSDSQPGVPITVPAGQTLEVALPFAARTDEYGCEARVRLTQGSNVLDEASDVFSVSDNVFRVGLESGGTGGLTISTSSAYSDGESIARDVENCRANYSNWWEKMFWAPDDWGDLTPETEEWMSGQVGRWENANRIREFIAAAKPHGIKAITYVQNSAKGPPGWGLLRQHPEWFYASPQGIPASWGFDAWDLAHWNDFRHTDVPNPPFAAWQWPVCPDLRQPAVLEWGIKELIASMKDFGWDGVRFDGHFTAGNDALSTANMQRVKQAMWQENLGFLFGFNWGLSFGHQMWGTAIGPMLGLEHEFRESMAGGGAYVQEGINYWGYSPTDTYHLWSHYATAEEANTRGVHALGGSYHFIYALARLNPIDRLYKFAIGTMCGAHPVYGGHFQAPGCPSWGRFLTRWSGLVWDAELQPVSDGDVNVIADAPLLWRNWAKQRVVDQSSRQVVVHLVDPQVDDRIDVVDDLLPPPVANIAVRVRIPDGQGVTKAILLDPWQGDQPTSLEITRDSGIAQVTVPKVEVWSIVVFELSGTFAPPPPPGEPFTEAPDPAEVEAGRLTPYPVVGAPLTPDELAGHRRWLYETDAGYNSVGAHGVLDPDADNGMAQVRESNETWVNIGRNWMGSLPPGRYVARMRIKLEDRNTPTRTQSMRVELYLPHRGELVTCTNYATEELALSWGLPPERILIADGIYHYYDLAFELRESLYIMLVGKAEVSDPAGTRFLLDHILIELWESYSDAMLDATPPPPHAVEVGGAPGLDVLVVNGFTWDTFRLPQVWGAKIRVQELWWRDWKPMDDFPQTLDGLRPYDVIVLADMDVGLLGLEARRAVRDYVAAGGGLVLLGGPYAFGQGALAATYVEDVLPVSVSAVPDLQQTAHPLVLTPAPTPLMSRFEMSLRAQRPEVYWRHLVEPRPGAEVQLRAGSEPVLITGSHGKGRVAVFSATALGTPEAGHLAFWQWDTWPALLADVIYWSGALPNYAERRDRPRRHGR